MSLLRDLEKKKSPVLAIDAKATEHTLHRHGIGRMKHFDVAHLWLQDEVRSNREEVRRVKSGHTGAVEESLWAGLAIQQRLEISAMENDTVKNMTLTLETQSLGTACIARDEG